MGGKYLIVISILGLFTAGCSMNSASVETVIVSETGSASHTSPLQSVETYTVDWVSKFEEILAQWRETSQDESLEDLIDKALGQILEEESSGIAESVTEEEYSRQVSEMNMEIKELLDAREDSLREENIQSSLKLIESFQRVLGTTVDEENQKVFLIGTIRDVSTRSESVAGYFSTEEMDKLVPFASACIESYQIMNGIEFHDSPVYDILHEFRIPAYKDGGDYRKALAGYFLLLEKEKKLYSMLTSTNQNQKSLLSILEEVR